MKKRAAALILLITVLGTIVVGAAEISVSDVLKTVKERIEDTDGYTDFESNIYEDGSGNVVYSFSWQKNNDYYERLYVNCTQSGIITSYSDDSAEYPENGIKFIQNRIPAAEAVKRAQRLADELNPSFAGELIVEMPEVYSRYAFGIKRVKNGLAVKGDGGRIILDKNAEKICSYEVSVTENHEVLPAENLISKDEAVKNYAEKLGMELEYKFGYDYNRETHKTERKLYLQYTAYNGKKINAVTGETVIPSENDTYKYSAAGSVMNSMNSAETAEDSMFSKTELAELEKVNGLKTKAELIKIAQEALSINENLENVGFEIRKESYYTDVPVQYLAVVKFKSQGKYANVSLNAATGEIVYMNKNKAAEGESRLTAEKLKAIADETAEKFCGMKFKEYKAEEYSENGYFTYTRYINGIKFDTDKISVGINRTTGDVESYSVNYTDADFPSSDGVISKYAALKCLFGQVTYEPVYIKTDDKLMIPAYDFTDGKPLSVNAETGELIQNGKEYKDDIIKYNDMENHYAKTAAEVLAELGHGFDGGSFKPDEYITQKEFLNLLFGKDNKDVYEWVEIEKAGVDKNETAFVTKEDAAKILVYNLGNGMFELAEEDIFKAPFADVTENIGFAAILKGKKIVNGDEYGMFCPKENLTRANAAVMIYRYFVSNGHN